MINNLKVYFIKSLDDSYLQKCIESFRSTVPSDINFEIKIVEEKNQEKKR